MTQAVTQMVLDTQSSFDEVKSWLGTWMEEKPLTQVLSQLEAANEEPDGEVLLSIDSAQELAQGLNLPFSLSKKIFNRLHADKQLGSPQSQDNTTGSAQEAGPISLAPKRPHQTGSPAEAEDPASQVVKRAKQRQAEPMDVEATPAEVPASIGSEPDAAVETQADVVPETQADVVLDTQAADAVVDTQAADVVPSIQADDGGDDDDDFEIEVVEVKAAPQPVPAPAPKAKKRGRPKKSKVKAEPVTPAGPVKMEMDADCAAHINLGVLDSGKLGRLSPSSADPTPYTGSGRRAPRKAATAAKQLLQTVAKAERAHEDDYTASTRLHAMKLKSEPGADLQAVGPSGRRRKPKQDPAAAGGDEEGEEQAEEQEDEDEEQQHDDDDGGDQDAMDEDARDAAGVPRVVVKKKEESDVEIESEEESEGDAGDAGDDSDYQPSPERGRRFTDGRRRANGQVKRWDDDDSDASETDEDEEMEVEVEEQQDEVFKLPRKADQPVPGVSYKYKEGAARDGFRYIIQLMDLHELTHMVMVLGLNVDEFKTYQGRKVNKDTRAVTWVTRKSPVSRWRKQLFEFYCPPKTERGVPHALFEEQNARELLEVWARDATGRDCMARYLDAWYRVYPVLLPDGSNIVDVLLRMWSHTEVHPPPTTCILGTRVFHVHKPADRSGVVKEGSAKRLLNYLEPRGAEAPGLKLNRSKHKGPLNDCRCVMAWLKLATQARGGVNATYKLYHSRARQEYTVMVTIVLKRFEVLAGLPELEDEDEPPLDADLGEAVQEANRRQACDLLGLYKGLDHVRGVDEHAERLERAAFLVDSFNQVVTELEEANVQEAGQGPDKLLNVGQMEELLHYVEGQEYDLPENIKRVLKRMRLKLLPTQVQSVAAIMQEEQSCGSGRHLWTELPLPPQPKYDPIARKRQLDAQQRDRAVEQFDRRGNVDEGETSDEDDHFSVNDDESDSQGKGESDSDGPVDGPRGNAVVEHAGSRRSRRSPRGASHDQGDEMEVEASSAAHQPGPAAGRRGRSSRQQQELPDEHQTQAERQAAAKALKDARRREQELLGDGAETRYPDPDAEAELEEAEEGVRPVLRLFCCPLLNAFVWGTSLTEIKRRTRASLPIQRGIMCCLEVGMGKTAVALAAAMQSRRSSYTHMGREVDDGVWDESLLFDAYDGHRGHLFRGGTLVVAPKTLLPQWETIEITKFLGRAYKEENVVNSSGVSGKRKPTTPEELSKYDIVLINAESLMLKANTPLYAGVLWERVVVDEAHQEPGLMDALSKVPSRSLLMLTGTPVVQNADDAHKMMHALGLPAFSLLARSAYRMGYILSHYMVRYTFAGVQLTGEANYVLPPKTERCFEVAWNRERLKYDMLEEFYQRQVQDYVRTVAESRVLRDRYVESNRKPPKHIEAMARTDFTVHHTKVMEQLRPLRHACAGGIPVELKVTHGVYQQYPQLWWRPPPKEGEEEEESDDEQYHEDDQRRVMVCVNSKIQALMKAVKQLQRDEPDAKMVVFSCFTGTLEAIKLAMEPEGFQFRTMTSSMSMKQRAAALDDFMNDPPTTIFLLSSALASVGLTLVAANHMFLVEPGLNPAQEVQAVGRIHRMGQTKPVTITRLVMQDSVEMRIRALMDSRRAARRSKDCEVAACNKQKTGKKWLNSGDDVSGVCATANTEELLNLFG